MTTADYKSAVEQCHRSWQQFTGMDVPLSLGIICRWEHFLHAGFTEPDLVLVINYIKRRMQDRKNPRQRESLRLDRLIEDTDKFAMDLAMARGTARIATETPRQRILKATGRPVEDKDTVRTPAQVMAEHQTMAALLKQWKESNL